VTRPTRAQRRLTLRRRALLTAWLLAGGVIVARSAELQVVEGAAWTQQAVGQHSESIEVPAPRGAILDRNGLSLAVSHETFRVSIAPRELGDRTVAVAALVTNLEISREKARSLTDPNRRWAVAPGRYPPAVRAALADLRGVYLDRQLDRVHPYRDLARGLLGNVQENEGRGGIEQQYEEALRGRAGREIRARNSDGRLIPGKLIEVEPPLPGGELVLTIDRDLQEIGHEALKEAIEETGATGGDLLVTDPETGEILAMVSIRAGSSSAPTAITTPYEPGSTLKPFTVAAILEAGVGTLQDSVDTGDGRWTVAGRTITDVHAKGKITLSEALRESSNVGVAKIAMRLSAAQQYENLRDFGFGVPSGIVLPGEASGTLRRPDRWSAQSPVSLAIGYEIAVTPLQMAMAYGALANGGYLMEPLLVREVRGPSKEVLWKGEPRRIRKVVSETTTRQIARVMVEVVEDGTGTAAALSSFAVAGKSGTSRAYGPDGYEVGDYYSSFVGFFPADEPQLVVYVKLEKPQGAYYGGATAAPVTRATMQAVLAAGRSPLDRRALVSATSTPIRRPYLPTARFASQPLYPPPNPVSGPSAGEETVGMAAQVPSVEGLSARVAARRLHALGYRVLLQTPGIVRRTLPPAGERLPAGDTVRLETRRGEDG